MRDPKNVEALKSIQPDYMGFIFWSQSARYVNQETPILSESIKKTGVFVDASLDYIETTIENHHLQTIQLHGNENPAYCKIIRSMNKEVIKAFSIKEKFDFEILEPYLPHCDYFLFDTKGELPGGNGYTFDWTLLKNYPYSTPFFLSGGIGLEHLSELQTFIKNNLPIHALDVNSKFELKPGLKNIEKIKQFKEKLYEL